MKFPIPFTKASGAGNDFVLVNNMAGEISVDFARLAVAACDRHFGIGADGLLLLEKSASADFTMTYFNADGSYGGMCGNGGRCVARYAFIEGIAGRNQRFEALGHAYDAEVLDGSVRLHMIDPAGFRRAIPLSAEGKKLDASFIDTGSPHAVIFEADLETIEVVKIGRAVRRDPAFHPGGTNVNFVHVRNGSTIDLRTYERGVEAETLACGTGSVASALISSRLHGLPSPVTVGVRSGETLTVHFRVSGDSWTDVVLEGSAHILFTGTMIYMIDESKIRLFP